MIFILWAVKGNSRSKNKFLRCTANVNINVMLGLHKIAMYNYQVINTCQLLIGTYHGLKVKTEMPPTLEFRIRELLFYSGHFVISKGKRSRCLSLLK